MDPIGKKLLDVARKELGYTEKGDGYTKYGDWYAKNVDEDHDSYFATAPWCDMFLTWAADKAGVKDSVGQFASTIEHATWFKKEEAWGTRPKPGALVFYSWSGSKSIDDIDHVGLVESVDGGTIHTIEANVDGIHLKRKERDQSNVVGYGYPGQVKVAHIAEPPAATTYVPKHAAPPPAVNDLQGAGAPSATTTATDAPATPVARQSPLAGQEAALGGVLALVMVGTIAIAVGKSQAVRVAAMPPPVRVRKRGRHHRTAAPVTATAIPVALPADVTPAVLDAAEAGTAVMPALSAAVAQHVEDQEFWGKISTLQEDEELVFWDSLHKAVSQQAPVPAPPPAADPVLTAVGGHLTETRHSGRGPARF